MDAEERLSLLVSASPRLAEVDAQTLAEWDDEPAPEITRMAALGRAFGRLGSVLPAEELSRIAQRVENLMNADQDSRNAVGSGFLEALGAEIFEGGASVEEVAPLLGPRSREIVLWWLGLEPGTA